VVQVPDDSTSRPDIVFADFEQDDYGGWTTSGKAFADHPYHEDEKRFYNTLSGYEGKGFVNTHLMRHGEDAAAADAYKGRLTSPEFTIDRKFIRFRIGGGADVNRLGLRLIVDGKDVRRAAGRNEGAMRAEAFDVHKFQGKPARLQIVDETGGAGDIPRSITLSSPTSRSMIHRETYQGMAPWP
jgi:levanase